MKFSITEQTTLWALKNGLAIWCASETTSTNQVAKDLAPDSASPRLFLTDHQTQGRGRGSNQWSDQNGDQLLSSWLFKLKQAPQPILSPLIGLSLYQSLKNTFPDMPLSLKAPNDIYLQDKKLAGILIESLAQGDQYFLVVGLGLNVWKSALGISSSISLAEHTWPNQEQWWRFLDLFFKQSFACVNSEAHNLSPEQREKLRQALNLFPFLKEPYLDVCPDGSLIQRSQKIDWSSL